MLTNFTFFKEIFQMHQQVGQLDAKFFIILVLFAILLIKLVFLKPICEDTTFSHLSCIVGYALPNPRL